MASAPPLLLLAGWGQSSRFWDRFLPWLDGFVSVLVDNRETGQAGSYPEGFTIDDLAADALAVADREVSGTFSVVGHSMGGMIAQALAFQAPERVERLVLVSTSAGRDRSVPMDPSALSLPEGLQLPDDPQSAAVAIRAAFYERLMGSGGTPPASEIASEEAQRAQGNSADMEGMIRQLQAIQQWNPTADLKDFGLDVAVVHGDLDLLVPYPNGKIVAESAGVPLTTLRGVGHMVPWEDPAALARVIREGGPST